VESAVNDALVARDRGNELPFVIRDLDTGALVGSTRYLDISVANRGLEIGWTWLNPSVWRSRVNSECKYLLLSHAFEALGAIRVQLKTDQRNLARLGAVREGVLRSHMILQSGYVRDTVFFSIIAAEWPAVKERLQRVLQASET
jgi:RimJ/RimL family protein N-acetyltransferase